MGIRRTLFIAVAVIVPAVFLFFGVRGFEVRNAVVTADITTVRSPIAGEVVQNPFAPGQAADGTTALQIRNPRSDSRTLDALTAELSQVLRDLEQLQGSLDWYDEEIAQVQARLRASLSAMQLELQLQHEIVLAEVRAQEARVAYLAAQYERAQRLQGTATSQATLELTAADLQETRAKIEALRVKAEQLEQRMGFLGQDLPLADFADHATLLTDRLQDMELRRHLRATEIASLESRLDVVQERLESEQRNYDAATYFRHAPPATAVVWEVFLGPSATVTAGASLYNYVDCSQRFVQVAVGDATSELLRPHHPVKVSLYGQREMIQGQVAAVFGSGAGTMTRPTLAAHVAATEESDAIVLIELPPADKEARSYRLCDIGRTAYVQFEGIGFLDPLLNRLW